jgi:hypothetical protein
MTTTFPVNDFMTFNGISGLAFNLGSIGPGSSDTDCADLTLNGTNTCSAFSGSPFLLTLTATGTEVELSATGTAVDGSGTTSDWIGQFSETITTLPGYAPGTIITPEDIQTYFVDNPDGSITSPYSGTFVVSFTTGSTPEPSSLAMLFLGTGVMAIAARRRRHSR